MKYFSTAVTALFLAVVLHYSALAQSTDLRNPDGQTREQTHDSAVKNSSNNSVTGVWKEFWAPGQETDVTYNDIYEVELNNDGDVTVKIKDTDGSNISDIVSGNGRLSFTQHTSFDVKYSLVLKNGVLEGTATTPEKTVPIRWENVSSEYARPAKKDNSIPSDLAGRWEETWAPGQETDVTYHDIYIIKLSGLSYTVQCEKSADDPNIEDISFADGWLEFTQQTAFAVHYKLKSNDGGKTLTGTATTPHKTVPILWERIR